MSLNSLYSLNVCIPICRGKENGTLYFLRSIFIPLRRFSVRLASVVQWIERGFPKPKIRVRFPSEVHCREWVYSFICIGVWVVVIQLPLSVLVLGEFVVLGDFVGTSRDFGCDAC